MVPARIGHAAATGIVRLYAGAGCLVAFLAAYQTGIAVAALFHRPYSGDAGDELGWPRLTVVVPAHDEAGLVGRCVASLQAQRYPRELRTIVVVADNCTDDTPSIARAAGANVLVREEPNVRGKGHALRWALERVLSTTPVPDGVVIVDADCEAEPDFLARLAVPFRLGAPAVQGESLLSPEGSGAAAFRAAAFLLVNRTRPSGRAVLGAASHLAGSGMLFSRQLLLANPWDAFTSTEDVEYWVHLRRRGIAPVFARGAVLHSPAAPNPHAAAMQQLRWEGGRFQVARAEIPKLLAAALRERRPSLAEVALELATPPLGVLAAAAAAGTAAGTAIVRVKLAPKRALAPWAAAAALIPAYVLVGLRAANAPGWAYRSLAQAPLYVLTKLATLPRAVRYRADTWVRTERTASGSTAPGRGDT